MTDRPSQSSGLAAGCSLERRKNSRSWQDFQQAMNFILFLDSRMTPSRWPSQSLGRCWGVLQLWRGHWLFSIIRSPEISVRDSFQKWAWNACPAVIFKPVGRRRGLLQPFGGGNRISANHGRVTALRHSFYVQAAVSHERDSQWLWKLISWADYG